MLALAQPEAAAAAGSTRGRAQVDVGRADSLDVSRFSQLDIAMMAPASGYGMGALVWCACIEVP